jgi:peptidoglycan/xylan/chitin deacetylase (PgdA/CDA1 family)
MKKSKETSPKTSNTSFRKKPTYYYWLAGGILLSVGFLALGWFWGHQQQENYSPYQVLKGYDTSRHGFIVKSAEVSVTMANLALQELKKKNIQKAVEDCRIAIDIFPIDAKPYILLTKLYLMTGQERKMFDTLTLAGNSYPNFNNIVSVIDDENLDKLPLEEPQGNVYLSNFPENRKMAMSFMFDDGEANVYKALPAFEKYGYRATIPVVVAFVSNSSNDPFWGSWQQWKDAADRGFEIANHSMHHRNEKDFHGSDFDVSIDQAQEIIEKNVGHPVTAYVFPYDGYSDEGVSRALRQHKAVRTPKFLEPFYGRTVSIVIGGPHVSIETARRMVDIGLKRRLWLIAKCHGVTDLKSMRSFKSITPKFLEDYLAYIHSKNDEVWVDNFSNVFNYMSERTQTVVETKAFTEISVDFVLHNDKSKERLTAPLTVMVRMPAGMNVKSALTDDGRTLKVWPCATERLCVDVDAYDENVRVQWGKVS